MTPTVTAQAVVTSGKAVISVTSKTTNADGSSTETVNTSPALTRAQLVQQQTALQAQVAQMPSQQALAAAKLTAIGSALADTALA